MRVLFRDDDELVLKEVEVVRVADGRILLESTSGDPRVHVMPHNSWDTEALESLVRGHAREEFIDLEAISAPR
jgi:hypothetical protein